jgi:hypothetical protein
MIRLSGGNFRGMILNKAEALAFQGDGVETSQAITLLGRGFPLHPDNDAPVGQGSGQTSDLGDDFRAPTGEAVDGAGRIFRVFVFVQGRTNPEYEGGFARVTGIQDALQLIIAMEEGIGFIDKEGRTQVLNDAEEGWRADVRGGESTIGNFVKDGQQCGLAASRFGGFDADIGADVPKMEAVGVDDPKRQSFGGPLGKDNQAFQ